MGKQGDLLAGTFVIEKGANTEANIKQAAQTYGVDAVSVDAKPSGEMKSIRLPRVGLYKSWIANMDEGWTRWIMKDYGFKGRYPA